MKKIALILIALVFLFSLSACTDDTPPPPASGMTVSGMVTIDGDPLAGVAVLVNGERKATTDGYGIYLLSGLERGDVIAFVKEGYAFSPESYTVDAEANDLNALARHDDGEEELPDVPDEPDGPDIPDAPDPPDIPEEPEEPAVPALSAPDGFYAAYTEKGLFAVGFCVDSAAETFSVSATADDMTYDAEASLAFEEDSLTMRGTLRLGEAAVPFSASMTEDDIDIAADVTELVRLCGGQCDIVVTVSREGTDDVSSELFACAFVAEPPQVSELSSAEGILSWRAYGLPADTEFAVLANGVVVGRTPELSWDASSLLSSLPDGAVDGAVFTVVALTDGCPYVASESVLVKI